MFSNWVHCFRATKQLSLLSIESWGRYGPTQYLPNSNRTHELCQWYLKVSLRNCWSSEELKTAKCRFPDDAFRKYCVMLASIYSRIPFDIAVILYVSMLINRYFGKQEVATKPHFGTHFLGYSGHAHYFLPAVCVVYYHTRVSAKKLYCNSVSTN